MKREKIKTLPTNFEKVTNELLSKEYDFELITPMMGGDVESWQLDLKAPVRSSSVKGQLRFWWRTMQSESDPQKLLYKENEVWGGKIDEKEKQSSIKSPTLIAIVNQKGIRTDEISGDTKKNKNKVAPNYVCFGAEDEVKVVTDLKFELHIKFLKKHEEEVLNTLKLWTLFGGVGARTRRGAGSIYCNNLLKGFDTKKDINDFIKTISKEGVTPKEYPSIINADIYFGKKTWKDLLKEYGEYRQARVGQGTKEPGRSYWPEPDAIRLITGENSSNHKPAHDDKKWFPRAAFGLPIITKFTTNGDPKTGKNIQLLPVVEGLGTCERWPSPMILKTIKLANGEVISCCLVLQQTFPKQLTLKINDKKSYEISNEMLPFNAKQQKIMQSDSPLLVRESIYQHLARALMLEAL